jgi:hypothetical protein
VRLGDRERGLFEEGLDAAEVGGRVIGELGEKLVRSVEVVGVVAAEGLLAVRAEVEAEVGEHGGCAGGHG